MDLDNPWASIFPVLNAIQWKAGFSSMASPCLAGSFAYFDARAK